MNPAVINLTHVPYQPWCTACVMAKGTPDAHRRDVTGLQRREMIGISWDLCFTGTSCEKVEEFSDVSKTAALVIHDAHSGAIQCVPIQGKSQTKYMSREVLRFIISWLW